MTFFQLNQAAVTILDLAAMLVAAFALSRITKLLKLPNVTAYILSGILIGPYGLKWISASMINSMSFVTDIALSFIAFGVGKYFKWKTLKHSGTRVIIITVMESLAGAFAVTAAMLLIFKLPLSFSLLLGAIAAATAPASTLMTIRQYKAKGHFVNTILQVVALDDAVSLLAFSVCATISRVVESADSVSIAGILLPIGFNLLSVVLGIGMGFLLKFLIRRVQSSYNRLLMVIILLLTLAGLCAAVDVSPLLGCMALGMVHANITEKKDLLFKTVDKFTPPVLTFFFVLSGLRLNVPALAGVGMIGVVYFFVRILGKYAGATLGAVITRDQPEVKKYLGLALVPQAGVSIGLAVLGERMLSPEMGSLLSTIILSSAVLYEIAGPALAKLSLHLAGVLTPSASSAESLASAEITNEQTLPVLAEHKPSKKQKRKEFDWHEENPHLHLNGSSCFPFRKQGH